MQISWYGQSCFSIKTKNSKGEEINIVINPFNPKEAGIKLSKLKADIVLLGYAESILDNIKDLKNAFIIDKPGEFEIKNIFISGIQEYSEDKKNKDNIIFSLEAEGINILHLGKLKNVLKNEQLTKLNSVDILLIPIGGESVINAQKAMEIINAIEPRITIPMYYKIPALKENLESIDKFSKEMGISAQQHIDKLTIKNKSLPQEGSEIIILNKK